MDSRSPGTAGITRRGFLYAAGAAGVIAAVGVALVRFRDPWPVDAFVELLDDPEAARLLGQAWTTHAPQEVRASHLIAALRRDLGLDSSSVTPDQLPSVVAERIRSEYADGHVGRIGNWVLSDTEIRLCALAALTAPTVARPQ